MVSHYDGMNIIIDGSIANGNVDYNNSVHHNNSLYVIYIYNTWYDTL